MSVEFQVKQHVLKPGVQVVEVLLDDNVVATLYPDGEKGVKIVSAHIEEVIEDDGTTSFPPIPAIFVKFNPQPYIIQEGRFVRIPPPQD